MHWNWNLTEFMTKSNIVREALLIRLLISDFELNNVKMNCREKQLPHYFGRLIHALDLLQYQSHQPHKVPIYPSIWRVSIDQNLLLMSKETFYHEGIHILLSLTLIYRQFYFQKRCGGHPRGLYLPPSLRSGILHNFFVYILVLLLTHYQHDLS